MKNTDIVKALLNGANYQVISYYGYPTGPGSSSNVLLRCEDCNNPKNDEEEKLIKIVEEAHAQALEILYPGLGSYHADNKTAVEICVDGSTESLFLSSYDFARTVATAVKNYDVIEPRKLINA